MTRRRDLTGASVVIVGASSGIGRAAALAFAVQGARLTLSARSAAALDEVVSDCRALGAHAIASPADVADAGAVDRVGRAAVAEHGTVDVWVHTASVLVAARFGDEPLEEVRRTLDVDALGCLHGALTALRIFRAGRGGTLIMVSSVLGIVVNPLVVPYVMSKFAVVGLARALRTAVVREPGIDVCVVLPGPIDTPLFERAGNHLGHGLRAIPPACAPERAAAVIVACARRPRREAPVGAVARLIMVAHRAAPALTERLVAEWSVRFLVDRRRLMPATAGTLFDAPTTGRVHGGWRRGGLRRRFGERRGRGPFRSAAVGGAADARSESRPAARCP